MTDIMKIIALIFAHTTNITTIAELHNNRKKALMYNVLTEYYVFNEQQKFNIIR